MLLPVLILCKFILIHVDLYVIASLGLQTCIKISSLIPATLLVLSLLTSCFQISCWYVCIVFLLSTFPSHFIFNVSAIQHGTAFIFNLIWEDFLIGEFIPYVFIYIDFFYVLHSLFYGIFFFSYKFTLFYFFLHLSPYYYYHFSKHFEWFIVWF